MCGFSGIFSKDLIDNRSLLQSLHSIKHRGPDNTIHATYQQEFNRFSSELSDQETQEKYTSSDAIQSNNWIGFNRLSILDLSNEGMQPFYDEDRKIAFLFNGEVYNFTALKEEFLKDIPFKSDSDTEVIFHLYLKLGDAFIHHLRGMFAIVVIDYSTNQLNVWRDRFGIKPFYYFINENQFIFSSEIKGILATKLVEKKVDPKYLAYSLYLNTNFAPNTIYKEIQSLEAATQLTVNLSTYDYVKNTYWKLDYQPNKNHSTPKEFLSDVNEVVQLASVADVKQAVMLSGGLDSGLLAYVLGKSEDSIDAISIFNEVIEEQNEIHFARKNAENANLNLLEIEIDNSVDIETIKRYILAEEEPNICPEPAYFLAENAHLNNYVVLHNALGLDELFYGYAYYYWAKMANKVEGLLLKDLKYLLKGNKRYKYEELTTYGLAAFPLVMRSVSSWKAIKELFKDYDSNDWEHPIAALLRQVRHSNSNFDQMPLLKQISYLDFYYYISSHHSLRSDIPSMLHHIEMRFPYLDHHFIQKYFNYSHLDQHLSFKNNKPFLRKAVADLLPKEVLYMPKKGFSMPTTAWLKDVDVKRYFPEINKVFGEIGEEWLNDSSKKWWIISASLVLSDQNEK